MLICRQLPASSPPWASYKGCALDPMVTSSVPRPLAYISSSAQLRHCQQNPSVCFCYKIRLSLPKTCKVLDDEIHFFLQCQLNNNLRNVLINKIKKYHAIIQTNWTFFPQVKIILILDQEFIKQSTFVRIAKMRFTLVNV